jgi:hypothetical protein
MTDLDLGPFVHKELGSWYEKPFSLVDRKGKAWDAVTDRALFVAVRRRSKHPRFRGPGEEMTQMLAWLHGEPVDPYDIRVDDMLRWIGPNPKGLGLVLGVIISLDLLAKLLGSAPLKKVSLWQATELVKDPRCLAFEAAGRWRALLMGHDAEEVTEEPPSFDLGSREATPFGPDES